MRQSAPKNWDATVSYITSLSYSTAVAADLRKRLHTPSAATASWPKLDATTETTVSNKVKIQLIDQDGHPAAGQRGLVAVKHLPPSSHIVTYIGVVHLNEASDTDAASDYDLSIDRELGLSIDASKSGNEARCINDYRGIASAPNAEFCDCWVQLPANDGAARRPRWERRIAVFVLGEGRAKKRARGIQPGEEIVVNYGRTFWSERESGNNAEQVHPIMAGGEASA